MDRLVVEVDKIKQSQSHEKLPNFVPEHASKYFIFSSVFFFWGGGLHSDNSRMVSCTS